MPKEIKGQDVDESCIENVSGIHLETDDGFVVGEIALNNFDAKKNVVWGGDTSFMIIGNRDVNGGLNLRIMEAKNPIVFVAFYEKKSSYF